MSWFRFLNKKRKASPVSIAKAGDIILVNSKYTEDVIKCRVENNDPDEQKIFLSMHYNKEAHTCLEYKVLHYSDSCLRNFKILNIHRSTQPGLEEFLDEKLTSAINKEEYEMAEKIKKAIEILKG